MEVKRPTEIYIDQRETSNIITVERPGQVRVVFKIAPASGKLILDDQNSVIGTGDGTTTEFNYTRTGLTGFAVYFREGEYLVQQSVSSYSAVQVDVYGINIYYSTEMGGGVDGYTKLNATPITDIEQESEATSQLSEEIVQTGNVRTTTTKDYVYKKEHFIREHENLNPDITYYYVITSVAYNPDTLESEESPYSIEISSQPFQVTDDVFEISPRTHSDIVKAYIESIWTDYPDVDLKPGTVNRDVMIDPPAKEVERLYKILDFISKSQSILTLNRIDDADGDRVSDDPATSATKQDLKEVFFLEEDDDVQDLIDSAFAKKAADVGITRAAAQEAVGEVTFYSDYDFTTLGSEISIPAGTTVSTVADPDSGVTAKKFTTLSTININSNTVSAYYNSDRARYEFPVSVQSVSTGEDYNVPADTITVIEDAVPAYQFNVTNLEAAYNGTDAESNWSLSQRIILAFIGVDIGTKGGYLRTMGSQPNVEETKIVDAGNYYMQRDYDDIRNEHNGGKVDVYINGDSLVEYTDVALLEYTYVEEVAATVIDASNFIVEVDQPDVSSSKPIFEVQMVRNNTKGAAYNLSRVKINSGNRIRVDQTIAGNVTIGMDAGDIIEVSYRYREDLEHVFQRQPVHSVSDLDGLVSGEDLETVATLVQDEDPLLTGNSSEATDNVLFAWDSVDEIVVDRVSLDTPEDVTLNGTTAVDLDNRGVDRASIVVQNSAQTVTYVEDVDYDVTVTDNITSVVRIATGSIGDGDTVKVDYTHKYNVDGEDVILRKDSYSEISKFGVDEEYFEIKNAAGTVTYDKNIDYELESETTTTAIRLRRISGGAISEGQTVKAYYECTENLTAKYVVNSTVLEAQNSLDTKRHITADVLAKEIQFADIDIDCSIKPTTGATVSALNANVRTAVSEFLENLLIGTSVYQSDIIGVLENVAEVAYVTVPLTTLARIDGTQIVKERLDFSLANYTQTDGSLQAVSNEVVILSGSVYSQLSKYNIDDDSIVVTNAGGSITYTEGVDYDVSVDDDTTYIKRLTGGSIADGQTVHIDYSYFTQDYFKVDFSGSVVGEAVTLSNQDWEALEKYGVTTSTVVVTNTAGTVTYVENTDYELKTESNVTYIRRLATGSITDGQQVHVDYDYAYVSGLQHPTIEDGGYWYNFTGGMANDDALEQVQTEAEVTERAGRFYLGVDGNGNGYVVVSKPAFLPTTRLVTDINWTFTYFVYGETGPNDILVSDLEKVRLNDLVITIID